VENNDKNKYKFPNGIYIGQLQNGKRDGMGKMIYINKNSKIKSRKKPNIMVGGKMIKEMVREHTLMPMEHVMKVSGNKIKGMIR
jgi:hypothetical protein